MDARQRYEAEYEQYCGPGCAVSMILIMYGVAVGFVIGLIVARVIW